MPTYVLRVGCPIAPARSARSPAGSARSEATWLALTSSSGSRSGHRRAGHRPAGPRAGLSSARGGACVDGVDVEEIRPVAVGRRDPGMGVPETAEPLGPEVSPRGLVEALVIQVRRQFDAEWGVVLDLGTW